MELPDGYHDASIDVQMEILEGKTSEELAGEIADALGMESPRSGQLNKTHKARILIALHEQ